MKKLTPQALTLPLLFNRLMIILPSFYTHYYKV